MGGLARTEEYEGYLFDIGGHRFFTRVKPVHELWLQTLGPDFLLRPRLSRIYYKGQFFPYPLDPWATLRQLGIAESALCLGSYLSAHLFPIRPEVSFRDWVSNRFGHRLYRTFFESYTEKVWGIPCAEIQAEWAAQRIRGLSMASLVRNALGVRKKENGASPIKTLIEEFHYPRKGPGMMWTRLAERIEEAGGRIRLLSPVTALHWNPGRIVAIESGGQVFHADQVISSLPLGPLVRMLRPEPPEPVRVAARRLRYRDFLTVVLILQREEVFPDNWIYIHEPAVQVGRVQNYKNWSPEMVPDPATTSLGLEYFCFEGDGLWEKPDSDLIGQGIRELTQIGLIRPEWVSGGVVLRVGKAYPIYDEYYAESVETIREFVAGQLSNLQVIGRNGMHRYNNQDHSMLTGMLAARNVALNSGFDLWQVNADEDYHETGPEITVEGLAALSGTQPAVPQRLAGHRDNLS